MSCEPRFPRFTTTRNTALALGLIGMSSGALLAATHPAAAAAALAAAQSAVTCATTTACVIGTNTGSGSGVNGSSSKGYGVYGSTKSGTAGVFGTSPNIYGVYGSTSTGNGIGVVGYEKSSGTGVQGDSYSGFGVEALSTSGTGLFASGGSGLGVDALSHGGAAAVRGQNSGGYGGDFTGSDVGVVGRGPTYPIIGTNAAAVGETAVFWVTGAGDVYYRGALHNVAHAAGGATVTAFSAKTTLPTVEDTGTSQLVAGAAVVRFDPTFAASIDQTSSYRVFITLDGDTPHGVFVAAKSAGGFIVREAQAGRSSVSFDYRVVATALGQAGQRMTILNAAAVPHMHSTGAYPAQPSAVNR